MDRAVEKFLSRQATENFGSAALAFLGALFALFISYFPGYYVSFVLINIFADTRTAAAWGHLLAFGIIFLLFILDRGRGAELDALAVPNVNYASRVADPDTVTAGARLISEVVLVAPRTLKSALRYLLKGFTLSASKSRLIAPITVLMQQSESLGIDQLAEASGRTDPLELYKELRLLRGILWLGEGGTRVKLSDEVRREFGL